MSDGEFCVYAHARRDTGGIFYIGKGLRRRPEQKSGRSKGWREVVDAAGGFDVVLLAEGISDAEAIRIEAKEIEARSGLVNSAPREYRKPMVKRSREVVNTTLDPELTKRLRAWCEKQPVKVQFARAIDAAIAEFLRKHE